MPSAYLAKCISNLGSLPPETCGGKATFRGRRACVSSQIDCSPMGGLSDCPDTRSTRPYSVLRLAVKILKPNLTCIFFVSEMESLVIFCNTYIRNVDSLGNVRSTSRGRPNSTTPPNYSCPPCVSPILRAGHPATLSMQRQSRTKGMRHSSSRLP
jgi:hypothetical protein